MTLPYLPAELRELCAHALENRDLLALACSCKEWVETALRQLYVDIVLTSFTSREAHLLLQGITGPEATARIASNRASGTYRVDDWALPLDDVGQNTTAVMLRQCLPTRNTPEPAEVTHAYRQWRASLNEISPGIPLLAFVAAVAPNLESLEWRMSGGGQQATFVQLMLAKIRADVACDVMPYTALRNLEVPLETTDREVLLLPDLRRLAIHDVESSLAFDLTAIGDGGATALEELEVLGRDVTPGLQSLLQMPYVPNLHTLRINDFAHNADTDYSQLPNLLSYVR
jgi:hypothetical protein